MLNTQRKTNQERLKQQQQHDMNGKRVERKQKPLNRKKKPMKKETQ